MRYLLITCDGSTAGLASRLEREGHSCYVFVDSPNPSLGAGLVKSLVTPRPLRDREGHHNLSTIDYLISQAKPEIVIFDYTASPIILNQIEKHGIKVIGSYPLPIDPRPKTLDRLVAIDGWFNGQDIVGPFGYHVLYTRMIPGGKGIGPTVPATAVLSQFSFHRTDAFKDIEADLRPTTYRGPVTGYAAPNDESFTRWQGGFTECTSNLMEVLYTPTSQFLVSIVNTVPSKLTLSANYSASIRITGQLWPAQSPSPAIKLPGFNEQNLKHAWPCDLMKNDVGHQTTGTGDGNVALFSARGNFLREATRRLQRTVKNVMSEELQYRFDVIEDSSHCRDAEKIFDRILTFEKYSGKIPVGATV